MIFLAECVYPPFTQSLSLFSTESSFRSLCLFSNAKVFWEARSLLLQTTRLVAFVLDDLSLTWHCDFGISYARVDDMRLES
jgi:hypothetical protein